MTLTMIPDLNTKDARPLKTVIPRIVSNNAQLKVLACTTAILIQMTPAIMALSG